MVSIGNLAVGGSGKTPFLILLGGLLKQRGIRLRCALPRLWTGYQGRGAWSIPRVRRATSATNLLLIARKLQVPVIVGEDRYAAGQFAEQKFGPQLHLLDDGFQHRRLARDFDIVLVTPTMPQITLLPAGRLREPLSSLSRADAVVLTNDTSADGTSVCEGTAVWRVRRGIAPPRLKAPCFAFCGIARPAKLLRAAAGGGSQLVAARESFAIIMLTTAPMSRELAGLRRQNRSDGVRHHGKRCHQSGPALERLAAVACRAGNAWSLEDRRRRRGHCCCTRFASEIRSRMRQSKVVLRPVAASMHRAFI